MKFVVCADLDHTADIQIHSCEPPPRSFLPWHSLFQHALLYASVTYKCSAQAGGDTLEKAMANAGLAMFNYMTPLSGIEIDPSCSR